MPCFESVPRYFSSVLYKNYPLSLDPPPVSAVPQDSLEHLQKPWMSDCRSVHGHFQAFLIRLRLRISGNGAYYLNVMYVEIGNVLIRCRKQTLGGVDVPSPEKDR
ncbi:hypothetical protein ALP59_101863 [Pseudomonas savastanoi]|uniref:Uncharacterized protein n=4 Tax=Pseudomonas syringae group TaxID=136849 RepID=A0A3M5FWC0_PSESS|nr:hypothetical protein ALO50_102001 [Pseudomonas syringae pv. cerasicola]KPX10620.1 hypothetical protein ALO73_101797 [Pseudomonas syringae pv. daphniphylli]KPX68030.1 hypothetical protein ALO53_101813 [Pseudomonas amygdali pv. photiniae]RMS71422.1 hypothetical protein ALP61_100361 [Pseudomonas savastanoi]RMS77990.1 hypothetical protein ALP59_101863 [Pseudomonas savastanoi]